MPICVAVFVFIRSFFLGSLIVRRLLLFHFHFHFLLRLLLLLLLFLRLFLLLYPSSTEVPSLSSGPARFEEEWVTGTQTHNVLFNPTAIAPRHPARLDPATAHARDGMIMSSRSRMIEMVSTTSSTRTAVLDPDDDRDGNGDGDYTGTGSTGWDMRPIH